MRKKEKAREKKEKSRKKKKAWYDISIMDMIIMDLLEGDDRK